MREQQENLYQFEPPAENRTKFFDDDPAVIETYHKYVVEKSIQFFFKLPREKRLVAYLNLIEKIINRNRYLEGESFAAEVTPPSIQNHSFDYLCRIYLHALATTEVLRIVATERDLSPLQPLCFQLCVSYDVHTSQTWVSKEHQDVQYIFDETIINPLMYLTLQNFFSEFRSRMLDLQDYTIQESQQTISKTDAKVIDSYTLLCMLGKVYGFFDTHPQATEYRKLLSLVPSLDEIAMLRGLSLEDTRISARLESLQSLWQEVFTVYWAASARAKNNATVQPLSQQDAQFAYHRLPAQITANVSSTRHMPPVPGELPGEAKERADQSRQSDMATALGKQSKLKQAIASVFSMYRDQQITAPQLSHVLNYQTCNRLALRITGSLYDKKQDEITTQTLDTVATALEKDLHDILGTDGFALLFGREHTSISSIEKIVLCAYAVFLQNGDIITDTKKLVVVLQEKLLPVLNVHADTREILPAPLDIDYKLEHYQTIKREALQRLHAAELERDGFSASKNPDAQALFEEREKNPILLREYQEKVISSLEILQQALVQLKHQKDFSKKRYQIGLLSIWAAYSIMQAQNLATLTESGSISNHEMIPLVHVCINIIFAAFFAAQKIQYRVPRGEQRFLRSTDAVRTQTQQELALHNERNIFIYPLATLLVLSSLSMSYGMHPPVRARIDSLVSSIASLIPLRSDGIGIPLESEQEPPTDTFSEGLVSNGEYDTSDDTAVFEVFGQPEGDVLYWHQGFCVQESDEHWYLCGTGEFAEYARDLPEPLLVTNLQKFEELVALYADDEDTLVRVNIEGKDNTYEIPLGYAPTETIVHAFDGEIYSARWNPLHSVEINYRGSIPAEVEQNWGKTFRETAVVYHKVDRLFGGEKISHFDPPLKFQQVEYGIEGNFDTNLMTEEDWQLENIRELATIRAEARNRKQGGATTREILNFIAQSLTELGIVYGDAEFNGRRSRSEPTNIKLAELMRRAPGETLEWDCDQFAFVIKVIAHSINLDVHMDIGYLDSPKSSLGGFASSKHMWLVFREAADAEWEIFEATSYAPVLDTELGVDALESQVEDQLTLQERAEREAQRRTLYHSLLWVVLTLATGYGAKKYGKRVMEQRKQQYIDTFAQTVARFERRLQNASPQAVQAVWNAVRSVLGVADVQPFRYPQQTQFVEGWFSYRGVPSAGADRKFQSGTVAVSEENARHLAEEFWLLASGTGRESAELAQTVASKLDAIISDLQTTGRSMQYNKRFSRAALRNSFAKDFSGEQLEERRSKLQTGLAMILTELDEAAEREPEGFAVGAAEEARQLLRECAALFAFEYRKL